MSEQANQHDRHLITLSAPSGTGKNTVIDLLLKVEPNLIKTISATTRPSTRPDDVNGKTYYFLTPHDFMTKVKNGEFVEFEEVYSGLLYGTLHSELERIWQLHKTPLLEIEVNGAQRFKKEFKANCLSIILIPPSLGELERRLRSRGTDSEDRIQERLKRAEYELSLKDEFDVSVINDDLEKCVQECIQNINEFKKTSLID